MILLAVYGIQIRFDDKSEGLGKATQSASGPQQERLVMFKKPTVNRHELNGYRFIDIF